MTISARWIGMSERRLRICLLCGLGVSPERSGETPKPLFLCACSLQLLGAAEVAQIQNRQAQDQQEQDYADGARVAHALEVEGVLIHPKPRDHGAESRPPA